MASLLNMSGGSLLEKGLPYDYEVEYLESTGTQWIEIPIITLQTDLECKAAPVRLNDPNAYVIGQVGTANGRYQLSLSRPSGNAIFYGYGDNNSYTTIENVASTDFRIYKIVNGQLFIDNTAYNSYIWKSDPTVPKCTLFGLYQTWNKTMAAYSVKIAYLRLIQNNIPIYDFVSVVKDGVGCFYDKVSETFFYNAGTGNFIVGPRVS